MPALWRSPARKRPAFAAAHEEITGSLHRTNALNLDRRQPSWKRSGQWSRRLDHARPHHDEEDVLLLTTAILIPMGIPISVSL